MTSSMRNFGASRDEWRPDVRFCGIDAAGEERAWLRNGVPAEDFSGETHISDLAIAATAGATKTSTGTSIHVSDIVELPATSLIGLTPAQVHFA